MVNIVKIAVGAPVIQMLVIILYPIYGVYLFTLNPHPAHRHHGKFIPSANVANLITHRFIIKAGYV
jgi:hypothetical protein